jgi:hypothetical protein
MATDTTQELPVQPQPKPRTVELPAPTGWPFVMAVGITLLGAGIVTNLALTAVGAILFLIAGTAWARLVFAPGVGIEEVPLAPREMRPRTIHELPGMVETLEEGMPGHRLTLPEKIHPYSAGAKGGFVGAFTMTVPALIYTLVSHHGLWFPLNMLVGMVMQLPHLPDGSLDIAALEQFRFSWFVIGVVIHGVISVTLGLMYGVMLPMLPGRPLVWGGLIAPLLWTGATYSFMGVLNPALHSVVHWPSFIASQFVYGLTVGFVVLRSEEVYVSQ